MARSFGELLKVLKLCPAVSFPERVDVVHIPDNLPCPRGELSPGQALEVAGCHDLAVHMIHAGMDVPPGLELLPTLGNLHGSDLSSPVIDILEQVPMDLLKVGEVEIPLRNALSCALDDKAAFDMVKGGCRPDTEFIPKDDCFRVDVGVVAHSAAAGTCSPFACAMM